MEYSEVIAREAAGLALVRQLEVLDFIGFLKNREAREHPTLVPKTKEEIETFLRSFNVDVSGYHFDRNDANAR